MMFIAVTANHAILDVDCPTIWLNDAKIGPNSQPETLMILIAAPPTKAAIRSHAIRNSGMEA